MRCARFAALRRIVHAGDYPNTISFGNESGEDAVVRLVGPTRQDVPVPNGTRRTVHAAAGRYYIVTRIATVRAVAPTHAGTRST